MIFAYALASTYVIASAFPLISFPAFVANKQLLSSRDNKSRLFAFNPQDFQAKHVGSYETLYSADNVKGYGSLYPVVTLFAQSGVGDQSKEILRAAYDSGNLHTLCYVDVGIEDNKEWFGKYKYDLPILHMGDLYWMRGRDLTNVMAVNSIYLASKGLFEPGRDQPNAADMERQLKMPNPTEKKNGPTEMPRRSRSSDFQKLMVKGIASRGKEGCDLPE
jgi:hypothetical protein